MSINKQGLGLSLCVLVLDHKGVKGATVHTPGEAQGIWGCLCYFQHPQAGCFRGFSGAWG